MSLELCAERAFKVEKVAEDDSCWSWSIREIDQDGRQVRTKDDKCCKSSGSHCVDDAILDHHPSSLLSDLHRIKRSTDLLRRT